MVLYMVPFYRNVKFDFLKVLVFLLCGYYPANSAFRIVYIANPTWNEVNVYMEHSLTRCCTHVYANIETVSAFIFSLDLCFVFLE